MSEPGKAVPCPYKSLPGHAYWRRGVSAVAPDQIDPVVAPRFTITATDKVATAGSCFAQHIARYIRNGGGSYFVTEPGHPILGAERLAEYNYGTFSARFGNLYTVRQLLQMLQRAYGLRTPLDDVWIERDGSLTDPFRPFIQPGGFACAAEFAADRAQHYAAIRRMVEESDVFFFTLGLTEAWENAQDGTVYAICPGCGAGTHHEGKSRFHNFSVTEVTEDLHQVVAFLRARNPALRVLLTVSPVPLIATFSGQHVLAATTYSKSVLRVAAQMMTDTYDFVDYFPSYEIITAAFSRGAYFAEDLREVEEIGVAHAMRTFFRHYCTGFAPADTTAPSPPPAPASSAAAKPESVSSRLSSVICDEERLIDAVEEKPRGTVKG